MRSQPRFRVTSELLKWISEVFKTALEGLKPALELSRPTLQLFGLARRLSERENTF